MAGGINRFTNRKVYGQVQPLGIQELAIPKQIAAQRNIEQKKSFDALAKDSGLNLNFRNADLGKQIEFVSGYNQLLDNAANLYNSGDSTSAMQLLENARRYKRDLTAGPVEIYNRRKKLEDDYIDKVNTMYKEGDIDESTFNYYTDEELINTFFNEDRDSRPFDFSEPSIAKSYSLDDDLANMNTILDNIATTDQTTRQLIDHMNLYGYEDMLTFAKKEGISAETVDTAINSFLYDENRKASILQEYKINQAKNPWLLKSFVSDGKNGIEVDESGVPLTRDISFDEYFNNKNQRLLQGAKAQKVHSKVDYTDQKFADELLLFNAKKTKENVAHLSSTATNASINLGESLNYLSEIDADYEIAKNEYNKALEMYSKKELDSVQFNQIKDKFNKSQIQYDNALKQRKLILESPMIENAWNHYQRDLHKVGEDQYGNGPKKLDKESFKRAMLSGVTANSMSGGVYEFGTAVAEATGIGKHSDHYRYLAYLRSNFQDQLDQADPATIQFNNILTDVTGSTSLNDVNKNLTSLVRNNPQGFQVEGTKLTLADLYQKYIDDGEIELENFGPFNVSSKNMILDPEKTETYITSNISEDGKSKVAIVLKDSEGDIITTIMANHENDGFNQTTILGEEFIKNDDARTRQLGYKLLSDSQYGATIPNTRIAKLESGQEFKFNLNDRNVKVQAIGNPLDPTQPKQYFLQDESGEPAYNIKIPTSEGGMVTYKLKPLGSPSEIRKAVYLLENLSNIDDPEQKAQYFDLIVQQGLLEPAY